MKTKNIEVTEPIKLLDLIAKTYPDSSRTKHKEILENRVIIASRKITQFDFPLAPGMTVTIMGDEGRSGLMGGKMKIVFEDQHLFVVNKPVGLLSNSKFDNDITVVSELNNYLMKRHSRSRAHIVHRLDRDTSGLLIVAKSKEVSRQLEYNWKESVYDRRYVGVAWGKMPVIGAKWQEVSSWLTDGEYCVESSQTDNGGKLAVTHYKVLRTNGKYSLLEMKLDTGRRNQIRVHMRDLGHPLLKDPIYGYRDDNSPLKRLALHAYKLCFNHPVTGKKMEYETDYPEDFVALFEKR